MNKDFRKRVVPFITSTLILIIILCLMFFLEYIDISVILTIYAPIWIVGGIAVLFGKIVFANVIIIFAGIGLIAEYLVHICNKPYSNMSGAFLNTLILVLGSILGVVFQILNNRKLRSKINKN